MSQINLIVKHHRQSLVYKNDFPNIQYSQRHTVINHCDRCITHLDDLDISFVLLNISSITFRVLLTITQKAYQSKQID